MGGGIGMGNTCKPMAVSFQCMTKSTTNKKKYMQDMYDEYHKTLISEINKIHKYVETYTMILY